MASEAQGNDLTLSRNLGALGRIVIPEEIRTKLNLKQGTPLSIFVTDGHIVIKPISGGCNLCGSTDGLIQVGDGERYVCSKCAKSLIEECLNNAEKV